MSIVFYGHLRHVVNDPRNNQGNMELFGVSRDLEYNHFRFDTGVNTYIDSYRMRSWSIFSNVSHDSLNYGLLTPMLEIGITNKGKDYGSHERQTYPFIIPKIRIGERTGLFADISGLPKIGTITNGWVAFELGYKW